MKRWLVLLASCLALVAAGCGDDDDDDGGGGGSGEATTRQPAEQPSTTGGTPTVVKVSMKDTLFIPKDVRVSVGGTIKWTNDDSFAHTVTKGSGPGPAFDSGTVDGGETFQQKFDTAGTIDYVCKIHPNQTGSITVE